MWRPREGVGLTGGGRLDVLVGISAPADHLFVSDQGNNRVQAFDAVGTFLGQTPGLTNPHGIITDEAGNLYVASRSAKTVRRIDPAGQVKALSFDVAPTDPIAVAVAPGGILYVADCETCLIHKFWLRECTDWQLVYHQDFSTDPAWTSDDPAKLRVDPATGTFHGTQVMTEGTLAYVSVPGFDPNRSWQFEVDYRINRCDYAAGFTVGFYPETLNYNGGAALNLDNPDLGSPFKATQPVWTLYVDAESPSLRYFRLQVAETP